MLLFYPYFQTISIILNKSRAPRDHHHDGDGAQVGSIRSFANLSSSNGFSMAGNKRMTALNIILSRIKAAVAIQL